MGMPAAIAWWNLLQDQFQQAVTSAMSSAPPATPGAGSSSTPGGQDAKAAKPAQAAAPAPAPARPPEPGPEAESGAGNNGNGKARTTKSRTDKA